MPPSVQGRTFSDSHVHLTNYIQEGPDIRRFLDVMGSRVERAALFGIPLQQKWSHRISGDKPPAYYLQSNAKLYYYSFTDAQIAMAYRSLPPEARDRFDPMITGFNPTDMYAADHVRRVLQIFPGVFSGIGEFTIHKEFVTSKISDEVASLRDPALDRLLHFAGEVGLLALIHNDIDAPFPEEDAEPAYLAQMKDLLRRHPNTRVIWAHVGLGRVVRPIDDHMVIIGELLDDPAFAHLYFDISWDEVAKYLKQSPDAPRNAAEVVNRHSDRFLFGTDLVSPTDPAEYFSIYDLYRPLWDLLTDSAVEQVSTGNYRRLFDEARRNVRAWEAEHA
jgi:hypothetical protein